MAVFMVMNWLPLWELEDGEINLDGNTYWGIEFQLFGGENSKIINLEAHFRGTLWETHSSLLKIWAIFIVDLPILKVVMFHSSVSLPEGSWLRKPPEYFYGNSRILKWRYVRTIFQAIFWEYIP